MKTAMQELIEYLEARYLICKEAELHSEASTILMTIGDAKQLLEKEKEQIMAAKNDPTLKSPLEYYNQTYNQNK
jgi:hypothetical protein